MVEMTIADGLTELKLVNEKLEKQYGEIVKYSSRNKLMTEEVPDQKKYLRELIQSSNDLIKRYTRIKLAIMRANLDTKIVFNDREFSIAEAILYKQGLIVKMQKIWESVSDQTAVSDLTKYRGFSGINLDNSKTATVIETMELILRYYDPKEKERELTKLLELRSYLDRLIEKANHQTLINID